MIIVWGSGMTYTVAARETLANMGQVPTDPEDLVPEVQQALAALANLEVQIEIQRECLDGWSGSETLKAELLATLEQEYRAKRQPYVVRLAELKRQRATLSLSRVRRVVH